MTQEICELSLTAESAFASGEKVYLRPLELSDLNERYLSWLNDPEVTRYLESGTFPMTRHDLQKFYQEVTGSRNQVILAVVDKGSAKLNSLIPRILRFRR